MATYTVICMCDYPLAIFYGDKECMGTQRNFYAYAVTWSMGYFTYDFFMMTFVFEWGGSYFLQSMFHHVLASSFGILTVRYGGRSIPICYQVSMLCEWSMVFLNVRTFLGKGATGTLPLINNFCFFASYTIFRVIMWPILAYQMYYSKTYYDFANETQSH